MELIGKSKLLNYEYVSELYRDQPKLEDMFKKITSSRYKNKQHISQPIPQNNRELPHNAPRQVGNIINVPSNSTSNSRRPPVNRGSFVFDKSLEISSKKYNSNKLDGILLKLLDEDIDGITLKTDGLFGITFKQKNRIYTNEQLRVKQINIFAELRKMVDDSEGLIETYGEDKRYGKKLDKLTNAELRDGLNFYNMIIDMHDARVNTMLIIKTSSLLVEMVCDEIGFPTIKTFTQNFIDRLNRKPNLLRGMIDFMMDNVTPMMKIGIEGLGAVYDTLNTEGGPD